MSKNTCELINDLLPLYADNVCSEESRSIVAEHISECGKCRGELEKMGQPVNVDPAKDIAVIKRIKKRIFIEKVVVGALVAVILIVAACMLNFFLFHVDYSLDYHINNLAENIAVKEDDNGDLWFIRRDDACETMFMYPQLIDANGKMFFDEGFDKDNIVACSYTLKVRGSTAIGSRKNVHVGMEEQEFLFNINDKPDIDTIYYYDDTYDKMYVLWERS